MNESFGVASVPSRLTLSTCTVDIDMAPNSVTVTVAGELDMADADQVGQVLEDAAAAERPTVRLQLSGLTFADSSAVKAIILGAKAADEHGVTFELVNPHSRVRQLLQVTGLVNVLTIVEEADPND
jgi:anti-sigma B factor antagonist